MKFVKKAEFVLPACVLLTGLLWIFATTQIRAANTWVTAVLSAPDDYRDAFYVVVVSILLFIVMRNDRLKLLQSKKEITKLSLVAQKTSNGVIILDDKGHIEWVNDAFTAVSGYSLEEVGGKSPFGVLHGMDTNRRLVLN